MAARTSFENYLRKAFSVIFSPGSSTTKAMDLNGSLRFYYNIIIIPLILGVLIRLLAGGPISAGLLAVSLIVLIPISLFVNSFVYHIIIGKLFKLYKSDYWKVFGAFTYGIVPVVLAYWLIGIPIIGIVIAGIVAVWGYIVQIIALSNQLRMSRLKAFGTTLLGYAVIAVITLFVSMVFAVAAIAGLHVLGI